MGSAGSSPLVVVIVGVVGSSRTVDIVYGSEGPSVVEVPVPVPVEGASGAPALTGVVVDMVVGGGGGAGVEPEPEASVIPPTTTFGPGEALDRLCVVACAACAAAAAAHNVEGEWEM